MDPIEIRTGLEDESFAHVPVLVLVPEVRRALEEARVAFLRRDAQKASEALDRAADWAPQLENSLEVGNLASFYRLPATASRAFVKALRQAAGDQQALARVARDADGAGFPDIADLARRVILRLTPTG